jgi:dihydrofolate reductase
MIGIVAAVSFNGVIGVDGKLPWNYPEDMKHFRETTANSTVIMGRKTYESIGKPLPGRDNFIISSTLQETPGIKVFKDIPAALLAHNTAKDAWFIGGESIYEEGMLYAQEIVLTIVNEIIEGQNVTRMPWINPLVFDAEHLEKLSDKLHVIMYHRT